MNSIINYSNYTFIQLTYFVAKHLDMCADNSRCQLKRKRVDKERLKKYIKLPLSISSLQYAQNNMFSKIDPTLFDPYISTDKILLNDFDFKCLKERRESLHQLTQENRRKVVEFYNTQLSLRNKLVLTQQQTTEAEVEVLTLNFSKILKTKLLSNPFEQNKRNWSSIAWPFGVIIVLLFCFYFIFRDKTHSLFVGKTLTTNNFKPTINFTESLTTRANYGFTSFHFTILLIGIILSACLVVMVYFQLYSEKKSLKKQNKSIQSTMRKGTIKSSTKISQNASQVQVMKTPDKLRLPSNSSRITLASLIDINQKSNKLFNEMKRRETKEVYKQILHEKFLVKMYQLKDTKNEKK